MKKRPRPGGAKARISSMAGGPPPFPAEPSATLGIIETSKDEEHGRALYRPIKAEDATVAVSVVEDSSEIISVEESEDDPEAVVDLYWENVYLQRAITDSMASSVQKHGRALYRPIKAEDAAGAVSVVEDSTEIIRVEESENDPEAVVDLDYWENVYLQRVIADSMASSVQQIVDDDVVEDVDDEVVEDRKGKGVETCGWKKGRSSVAEQGESSGSQARDHPSPLPLLPAAVCGICMEEKLHSECCAMMGCDHLFCADCVGKYVEAKLQENATDVKCPQPGCKYGSLDPLVCRSILPNQVFDRWCTALCEALFVGEKRFYCPFKDCSAMLVDEQPASGDGGDKVVVITHSECPYCHRLFCAQCKVPWHAGVTCDVFQSLEVNERGREDILLMEMAKSKMWQRCPKCKFYVERTQGCKFIKCRCGSCFCYGCATPMTVDHFCKKCQS